MNFGKSQIALPKNEQVLETIKQATPQTEGEVKSCYHCGEDCQEEVQNEEGKSFCCTGCMTVHEILASNGLENYYQIEKTPGTRQQKGEKSSKFAYLDDTEMRLKLIDFSDENQTKVRFYLPQIHCASCVWLLEKLQILHPAILHSKVNFLKKEVHITFKESDLSLKSLVELLTKVGYEPHISLENLEGQHKKPSTQSKSFYIKLGVVGFCFGNIMMLSFPEYLGISDLDASFIQLFGYVNLLLSLPVFFYGANDYLKSAWAALKHKTVNIDVPISLGILALFLRSSYEILSQTGAGYLDSLGALIFLLLLGKWFQQKTFDNISFDRDYKSYFPIAVTVLKEGKEVSTPLSKLKKRDTILVRNGELIPADSILVKGQAAIDYSFVTGEAQPVSKKVGNLIHAGGKQRGGILELVIEKEVSQSYLTQLWNNPAFQKTNYTSLDEQTNRIGKYFTFAILLVAIATGIYWLNEGGMEMAINTFTAVLIIACPCALALNVPFTLGNALRIFALKGFYLKDTSVIERMNKVNHLVFDKTGTIATPNKNQITFDGKPLSVAALHHVAALVNHSTHPISQQVQAYLKNNIDQNEELPLVAHFKEVKGQGIEGKVNGQLIRLGKRSFVSNQSKKQDRQFQTEAWLAIDGKVQGCFVLQQELRQGIPSLIKSLTKQYNLSLLSGDNESEKARLHKLFGENYQLHFNQSPEEKLKYVEKQQMEGQKVAMLGDGLNDAGALKQSNVGIAITENVHQFSPACDAILRGEQLHHLDKYFHFAKRCIKVTYWGFLLSLCYNLVGLSFAVQGILSPIIAAILMPLSSISVVTFGVLMSTWYARKILRA